MPLIGYEQVHTGLNGSFLLLLHGRQDDIIPLHGGVDNYDGGGWIYPSARTVGDLWAIRQSCDMDSYERFETPFDNLVQNVSAPGYNMKCFEYKQGCTARVIQCEYDGTHGDPPVFDVELLYWLFPKKFNSSHNEESKNEVAPLSSN